MESSYQPDRAVAAQNRFVVLSGCSGGGKSSLLAGLGRRGYATCEEPGRQVVKEQLYIGGDALPWDNSDLFLELTISRSINRMIESARRDGWVFFDRGIIDQVNGFRVQGREIPAHLWAAAERFRYRKIVFVVPPWQEIFASDAERRHGFADSVATYKTLIGTYGLFGYRPIIVPKMDIAARADFVLAQLGVQGPESEVRIIEK